MKPHRGDSSSAYRARAEGEEMIRVVETKFEQIDGDQTRLAFIADDNKIYSAEFTPAARAQLMLQFQIEIARRREHDHM